MLLTDSGGPNPGNHAKCHGWYAVVRAFFGEPIRGAPCYPAIQKPLQGTPMPVDTIARLFIALVVMGCAAAPANADTVLITGANSGIGLEFARQYAADGWHVIATHRRDSTPESLAKLSEEFQNVRIETIDVTDPEKIAEAAEKLEAVPIDILINNAGVVGTFGDPRQKFGSLDYELAQQFIAVNSTGPLRVSEAFYDNVLAGRQKKIVAISSVVGSITVNSRGGLRPQGMTTRYWYVVSKAALNMGFVALAKDVKPDGVSVGLYHPGLVRVERTASYPISEEMKSLVLSVDQSVAALRRRIDELTPDTSGRFYSYTGDELPW